MAVAQATSVSWRRIVYGANVVIQVVLVVLAVVALIYVAQRYKRQTDLTRTGVNSLNPRTEKLLRNLPEDITITGVYTVLSEYDQRAQKRQDRVRDLLALYESAGRGHVTANLLDPMKDRVRLPVLLKRLREKPAYQNQAQKHIEVLKDFPALNQRIRALVDQQAGEADRLLAADASLQGSVIQEISQELRRLARQADEVTAGIQELQSQDIPAYGQAVERARKHLEAASSFLQAVGDWVRKNASSQKGLSADALAFLQKANGEYTPLLTDINALLERTKTLEPVELEELSDQLNRWSSAPPILVENADKAVLLPFNEVWPFRKDPTPRADGDDRDFAGEQAVSSAILKLTEKQKTGVVFTRFGGPSPIVPDFSQMNAMNMRQMPRAPFGVLNDLLGKENFVTQDWDLAKQKTPPEVKDAVRTVYVVLPPARPQQQDPRRPPAEPSISPEDVRAVTDAVNKAGMAIFLAGWEPPASPMPGAPAATYEYADYLASTWGIGVDSNYLVLPFAPSNENPKLYVPTQQTQRGIIDSPEMQFTNHPIGKPLEATPGGFDAACPLKILAADKKPAGVQIEPIAVVKETNDIWAIKDISHLNTDFRNERGTYRREEDLVPPFPLALAAERGGGAATTTAPSSGPTAPASKTQRVVVFGSATFTANPMLELGGFVVAGGGFQAYAAYPANPDLFINALHWLTNDAERISVGAQPTDVPRLTRLKDDAWLTFWRVFLVGIWPGMALVVGGGVWLFRRR